MLLLLPACIPEPSGGVELRGRHVIVHADPAIPVCPSAIALADQFVEDTAAMLGVEPQPIDYYLIDGDTGCGYGQYVGSSCTLGKTVYANAWIHYHELVHAVDDSHPPALFVEGLAEALSKPSRQARRLELDRATVQLDLDSSTFRTGVPWQEYEIAGDFVRFVIERYGGGRYRAFASAVLGLSDPISTRRAFARAFGDSLDEVIAAWRASTPGASVMRVPVDDVDCQAPIAPIAADTWGMSTVPADGCATGTTPNGTSYLQPTGRYGFDVTTPGVYVVEAETDGGEQRGTVRSCVAEQEYEYRAEGDASRYMAVPLVSGRHAIDLAPGARSWSVARLGAIGLSCETAATFTPPQREPWQLDVRGAAGMWLRIAYSGTRTVYGSADTATAARACWGGCANLQCASIAQGAALADLGGQPLYIVLGATATPATTVVVKTIEDDGDR